MLRRRVSRCAAEREHLRQIWSGDGVWCKQAAQPALKASTDQSRGMCEVPHMPAAPAASPYPFVPPPPCPPPASPRRRQVSQAIQEENRLTGQVMDSLEGAMDQARASLKKTMRRLGRAYEQSRSNHMLYLILFALALFFGLYFWNRLYRLLKWIF